MTSIYLLTEGKFSDYHIEGVFSSRELAEAARAGNEDARIEVFAVDQLVGCTYGPTWEVDIEKKSGELDVTDWSKIRLRHATAASVVENEDWGDPILDYLIRIWSPISAEHAAKVAVEARQEWLRSQSILKPPTRP